MTLGLVEGFVRWQLPEGYGVNGAYMQIFQGLRIVPREQSVYKPAIIFKIYRRIILKLMQRLCSLY